jgi:hypothetical protein
MQSFYIILNHKTGEWLANATQRNKTSARLTTDQPPRLFNKRFAATQALDYWLASEWYYQKCGGFDAPAEWEIMAHHVRYRPPKKI